MVLAIVASLIGVAAVRRPVWGYVGLAAFGLVGVIAAATRPEAAPKDVLPSVLGAAAGAWMLWWFLRAFPGASTGGATERSAPVGMDRRRFFLTGAAGLGAAFVAGGAGRLLARRFEADASRAAVHLPSVGDGGSPVPPGADLDVPGLSTFITPNDAFYRVDTALLVPSVKAEDWQLRIHGMVQREMTLTFDQLMARPLIERDVTLTCVSNEVGGRYIGNARWLGAPLKDLLDEVGVDPSADQLVSRSIDGFTAGSPTATVRDGRDAMLAHRHERRGPPDRTRVPRADDRARSLRLRLRDEMDHGHRAHDVRRVRRVLGAARLGAASRDQDGVADRHAHVADAPGRRPFPVAGVAWAQHRGIRAVELRVDEGPWMPARLSVEDTVDTWRQWLVMWDATAGQHLLQVRATDRTGTVQAEATAPPFPDGATGYHSIVVQVS